MKSYIKNILKKIDGFLLPNQNEFHYGAYIWLVYLSIFFAGLYFHPSKEYTVVLASIGTLLFLAVYFHAYNTSSKFIKWNILALLVIASIMVHLTPNASVFFVYAASFCCRLGSTKKAVLGLVFIGIWILSVAYLFDFGYHSFYFYVPALLFSFMIGGVNLYQHDIELKRKELVLSQSEVRHLARISERERIARDLHDLIGHTFSVISLKSELAAKLLPQSPRKAMDEINQIEHISRDALSQIREVVTGYRSSDLNTELAYAKYVLESNNIEFSYVFSGFKISEIINKELAIILKELITNTLKHAKASRVKVEINQSNDNIILIVFDDGIGVEQKKTKGFGLQGIGERVKKLSGEFIIHSHYKESWASAFEIRIPIEKNHD